MKMFSWSAQRDAGCDAGVPPACGEAILASRAAGILPASCCCCATEEETTEEETDGNGQDAGRMPATHEGETPSTHAGKMPATQEVGR